MSVTQDRTPGAETRPPADHHDDLRSAPSALRLVMMREISTRGRSGAFLVSSGITLVFILGLIIGPTIFGNSTTTHRVGVVGEGSRGIVDSASALATADPDADAAFEVRAFSDVAGAEAAVDAGETDAVVVDGEELILPTSGGFGGSELERLLQRAAATRQIEAMVGQERSQDVVTALTDDALTVRALAGQESAENEGRALIAYGSLFFTYMLIFTYGVWTLNGVTEEKSNRVIEVLLAAASPWQLLAGKILGISVLGLSQFIVTVAAAMVAIRVTGAFDLPAVPVDMVATLVLWVVLGFGMYMVLCGAAGALASKTEDAQNAMSPISTLVIGSLILSFVVLDTPDGTAALVGTFVPFTAPFVIPIRAAFEVLPWWQHVAAVVVALVTIVLLVRIGARVYAGGALQFGGRLKWREAFRNADL